MQSFRTELENPVVERDIIELEKKIRLYREGNIPEEKFRSLRLARGIYGQRQPGVQMVRIKLPYGKMTLEQWKRIADVSDEYSTGNLHLTTRQDIQIHFVSLDRTPEMWARLDLDDITIREACGNTVRNITASDLAGIDADEPFDVIPYADAAFRYFLRNPICQDMGRKFKIAFSSSDADTAWSFMHDLGVIPKVRLENGLEVRGFKVLVGGGLGAQPFLAHVAFDFLEEDELIPYIESVLRVFDRYGERSSRHKARIKFLIQKIGLEEFTRLVKEERAALKAKSLKVDTSVGEVLALPVRGAAIPEYHLAHPEKYAVWKQTNVFEQKQKGYFAAYIRVPLGNIGSGVSRQLIEALRPVIANDVRVTANQGLQLRYILAEDLPYVFSVLETAGFSDPGFDSIADITACPGTDTCNLGISSSTGIAAALEQVIAEEFPELIYNKDIRIKISGCMNSCGQHGVATIGFHGSSLKHQGKVVPALQVLLGGGILGDGKGRIADKVIKVPSRRGPDVVRALLADYNTNRGEGERFNDYYTRREEKYFYELLKPIADLATLQPKDYIDWGQQERFETAIGVGECAGVVIDLVATLLLEGKERLEWSRMALDDGEYADGIYHAYSSFVQTAKALLLREGVQCNTQDGILKDFHKYFIAEGKWPGSDNWPGKDSFRDAVLRINQNTPAEPFAEQYYAEALAFHQQAGAYPRSISQ
ncbi:HEPN domain-containing protein [Puia dinghuensis]|uniref:Ferredoxin--nitrite reductase n=1 Tax=Puia dinghuensis TaxID=1792502 RepID=A0A8J2UJV3_9BACT|nr:HEPN domain-containing protein [Puia dinghuensis]GGB24646.1 ferredoxin--nitrite reductase [Puia dinghuensis]